MKLNPIFLAVLMCLVFGSCDSNKKQLSTDLVKNPKSAESSNSDTQMPAITFEKTEHDFGKLIQGEQVSCVFKFKNTGDAPLLINDVYKSCGCTASQFSKKPYAPGEEGKIEITYNSTGHQGFQHKTAIVTTNTSPTKTTLRIKAQVVNPDKF